MESVTVKQLHQETKAILDQLQKGESLLITRNGEPIARLEPVSGTSASNWDDIMADVWKAQTEVKAADRSSNPVLKERERRRR